MSPSLDPSDDSERATSPATAGAALTPAAALIERALLGDGGASVEVLRRLAAGDTFLVHAVSQSGGPRAEQVRAALLQFLALGTWEGVRLPLPPGFYAGREGQHLRDLIAGSVCTERAPAWQTTLMDGLRDPSPVVRQTAAALLTGCNKPTAVTALVATLSDRDEGVRWAAALALSHGGRAAVEAVLRRLASHELVPEIRHVSAYVLRYVSDLAVRQQVAQVAQALDASDYRVGAPLAAGAALRALSAQ
jgi:hypothetical protein